MGSLRSLLKKEPAPIRYEICLNASQSQFCLDWSTVSFDKLSEAEAQAKRWKCPPLSYYKTITEISKEYNNAFICMWGGINWRVTSNGFGLLQIKDLRKENK